MKYINCLTYNMSGKTQQNILGGSEREHILACRKKYGDSRECTRLAIERMQDIKPLHLLALQEISTDVEERIAKHQPTLDKTIKHKNIRLMYDSMEFGDVIETYFTNTHSYEVRPLMLVLFNDVCVINCHLPHVEDSNSLIKIEIEIALNVLKNKNKLRDIIKDGRLIIMGDFNDHTHSISKYRPIVLEGIYYSQCLSVSEMKKKIKSCCYRKGWDVGDYIIGFDVHNTHVPRQYLNELGSDHYPVYAEVKLI